MVPSVPWGRPGGHVCARGCWWAIGRVATELVELGTAIVDELHHYPSTTVVPIVKTFDEPPATVGPASRD